LTRPQRTSPRVSQTLKADLLLIFCTMMWGGTFVVVKDALADASVFVFLGLRFLVATALLAAIYGRQLRGMSRQGIRAGALTGLLMFSGFALQTMGLRLTTPSKAAFITTFSVALVPIFLALFGRRRIGVWIWAGTALAMAGLYLLTIPATGLGELNRGDLLVLGCAFVFAVHVIAVGHYTKRYSAGGLSLLQVATSAAGTLLLLPLLAVTRIEPARVAWTPRLILAVIVTAVFATALAFSAQTWAQQYTTASHAVLIFTLEPVFAALTSYLFVGERLGVRALAGAALILFGVVTAELIGVERERAVESS